jgi:hypothetical protein
MERDGHRATASDAAGWLDGMSATLGSDSPTAVAP